MKLDDILTETLNLVLEAKSKSMAKRIFYTKLVQLRKQLKQWAIGCVPKKDSFFYASELLGKAIEMALNKTIKNITNS